MNADRYAEVSELFQRAIELPEGERGGFLDEACAGDVELRAAVDELLSHDGDSSHPDAFGETALRTGRRIVEEIAHAGAARDEVEPLPERIGPFEVVRELGEGGMGTVYLCRQTEPVRRQVAVKLIKRGMDSKRILQHFAREREALERMEHPNIARMLDAGTTEDGRPWFAMELVDGADVTVGCDARGLSVHERLRVFVKVARAIQHAHQRGILHRDIKPSNVQVSEVDGELVPKVIDFGLARALDPDRSADVSFAGRIVGTPAYMSPEQADPTMDVDSRADVYSLGVLLYELVTGHLPFDHRLGHLAAPASPPSSSEVVSPSSRYASRDERAIELASKRGEGPRSMRRVLQGDLDWIVLLALEPDRERRYASASELANDVEAFLEDRPVQAGPPTAAYRIAKFYKRHRAVAWGATAFVALLVVGLAVTWQLTLRARDAERKALALLEDVRGQNDIFNHMLITSDPRYGGKDARFADVLQRGVDYTLEKYADQPRIAGVTLLGIGSTLRELGDIERARDVLLRGYELRLQTPDLDPGELSQAANSVGILFKRMGELEEAKVYYLESLEHAQSVEDPDDAQMRSIAATHYNLGRLYLYTAEIDLAEPHLLRAVELQREYSPDDLEVLTFGTSGLGELHQRKNELDVAEEYFRQSLGYAREAFPRDHPHLATALLGLGFVLLRSEQWDEAGDLLYESLEVARAAFPAGSVNLKPYLDRYAYFCIQTGELEEAEDLIEESESLTRDGLGRAHIGKLRGSLHLKRGELAEAEAMFAESLELMRRHAGEDSWFVREMAGLLEDARELRAASSE